MDILWRYGKIDIYSVLVKKKKDIYSVRYRQILRKLYTLSFCGGGRSEIHKGRPKCCSN